MDKNEVWMEKRCGRITASELGQIVSASGKVIDGNLSYVRAKRFERGHGFSLPVSARAMDIGNETEPDIFRWAVENLPECGAARFVYSKDLPEVPFWVPGDMPMFGASPDAYSEDESIVLEFKTMVGNETVEFFCDGRTCYEEKALRVFKDHGPQILGLFLSNPKVRSVVLVKYVPQRDDIMKDLDSPLAPWRGVVFRFRREDYVESIEGMRRRVLLFDAFIDSDMNPSRMKDGWELVDGKLVKVEKERKSVSR